MATNSSATLYERTWTGDKYEVSAVQVQTGQSWVVGWQLVDTAWGGIDRMSTFHEHIGCTLCRKFEFASRRR